MTFGAPRVLEAQSKMGAGQLHLTAALIECLESEKRDRLIEGSLMGEFVRASLSSLTLHHG